MRDVTAGITASGDDRRLLEHAVDAVANPHLLLLRLEVDVGCAALDGLADHALHELDHRRVLAGGAEVDRRGRQVVERPAAVAVAGRRLGELVVDRVGSGAAPPPLPQLGR